MAAARRLGEAVTPRARKPTTGEIFSALLEIAMKLRDEGHDVTSPEFTTSLLHVVTGKTAPDRADALLAFLESLSIIKHQ